jgi:hypothetical protein
LFISIFLAAGVVWCDRRAGTTAKQKAKFGHQKHLFTRYYSTGHMKSIFCAEVNHQTFEKTNAASSSSFRTIIALQMLSKIKMIE